MLTLIIVKVYVKWIAVSGCTTYFGVCVYKKEAWGSACCKSWKVEKIHELHFSKKDVAPIVNGVFDCASWLDVSV